MRNLRVGPAVVLTGSFFEGFMEYSVCSSELLRHTHGHSICCLIPPALLKLFPANGPRCITSVCQDRNVWIQRYGGWVYERRRERFKALNPLRCAWSRICSLHTGSAHSVESMHPEILMRSAAPQPSLYSGEFFHKFKELIRTNSLWRWKLRNSLCRIFLGFLWRWKLSQLGGLEALPP